MEGQISPEFSVKTVYKLCLHRIGCFKTVKCISPSFKNCLKIIAGNQDTN